MKKVLPILTLVLVVVLLTAGLIACNDETNGGATYLNPPLVTLNGNVASWEANPNATKFEISMGGSLIKVENTVTSRTLAEGVAFKVRAVGDGVNYLTSDWSNTVTYIAQAVQGSKDVNFVMINDTHGAFTDSAEGYSIGRVDSLITSLESQKGDQIFIHNGDAFQGSFVCGETYGLALVEALNVMEVDCFVLGNHEFDWGIDKIAAYADGNQANGEANFPFLGANIFYAGTTTRPDWIDAYTIVEREGVKVGIIGIMGYGQEDSILTRYADPYDFASPLPIVSSLATELRTTKDCDVVVLATHDYTYDFNVEVGQLSGNSRIDGIFTAHTHQDINEYVTRADGKQIAVVQSLHKNNQASTIKMTLDESGNYISSTYSEYSPAGYQISSRVQTVINKYQYLINEGEEVVGNTPSSLQKATLGSYSVTAMIDYAYTNNTLGDVDVSVINTGGVRATINNGDITRAEIFEVFPFNNMVIIVNMTGATIKKMYEDNSGFVYLGVKSGLSAYTALNDSTIYQVAVIDYVYENKYYVKYFEGCQNVETGVLMRDIFLEFVEDNL